MFCGYILIVENNGGRVNFRLKRVSNSSVVRNVGFPKAFMSSSTAAELSQAGKGSKSYGSEQIQVSKVSNTGNVLSC